MPSDHIPAEIIIEELKKMQVPEGIVQKLRKFAIHKDQKIVLSLGGGGAKGCVGNLALVYLLDKLNLMQYIDEIWGVSAGSMIGSAYCTGLPVVDLIKICANIKMRDFVTVNKLPPFKTDKIYKFFNDMLPKKTFEECIKPFYIIATRFSGEFEEGVIFSKGDIAAAVTSSISIPDIFEPFIIDGNMYADGGLVENTPCISVYRQHRIRNDPRQLAILSTCFGKEHYDHTMGNTVLIGKLMNMIAIYRYRLQLTQNELTRSKPNTAMLMINLDVPISKAEFNKMGPQILPVYGQLLDKLSYITSTNNWNIDY